MADENKKVGKPLVYATKYKQELKRIELENKGLLTPRAVVDAARSELSPLHNAFIWDDTEAAEKYRLVQARILMTNVTVALGGEKMSGYVNAYVTVNNVPVRGYVSQEKALSDEDISRQVMSAALREIEYWQEKYKKYQKVLAIINESQLKEVREEVAKIE